MRAGRERRERSREAVHAHAEESRLDGSEAALPRAPERDGRGDRQENEKDPSRRQSRGMGASAGKSLEDAAEKRRIRAGRLFGIGLRGVVGVVALHLRLLAS